MYIDESTFDIRISQYDWGVPVRFECAEGFLINDQIVLCFDTDAIPDKVFTVNEAEDFSFELALSEDEAAAIMPEKIFGHIDIPYSIKHYRNGGFLHSIENEAGEALFTLRIEGTVQRHGGNTAGA